MARTKRESDGLSYKSEPAITPHDTTELTNNIFAFIIDTDGAAGTVAMEFDDGTTLTINCSVGVEYKYSPKLIKSTGTTATSIKGLY